ncbi:MAG: hypothetical protein HFH60_05395 [Lachnospiraceae bacterium]|nr:hypothetical protein [Lachnospiraceae bacterium]
MIGEDLAAASIVYEQGVYDSVLSVVRQKWFNWACDSACCRDDRTQSPMSCYSRIVTVFLWMGECIIQKMGMNIRNSM